MLYVNKAATKPSIKNEYKQCNKRKKKKRKDIKKIYNQTNQFLEEEEKKKKKVYENLKLKYELLFSL